jgi:hypothetical protein
MVKVKLIGLACACDDDDDDDHHGSGGHGGDGHGCGDDGHGSGGHGDGGKCGKESVITILGVTQDEPLNGLGDGDTAPDAAIQGDTVFLRAERKGNGNGRVYRIYFRAQGAGGECTGSVSVCVPKDQKKGTVCIDDGQTYDSLGQP